ncbi:hypothetical protein OC846_004788 [Tilletia horrida]|uniref:AA1-like domain-containing protein n=1 Tax=Tilletia horrida TaxID=155126 RepID=A0AAN6GPU3_9BASI|nr:hypothetical protein OC846_004788 [Tilletia horrida]KAK0563090.1 hypothetical protein OC861_004997 [Tilletia horrida]
MQFPLLTTTALLTCLSALVSAAPTATRSVPQVKCSPFHTGTLVAVNSSGTALNAAFEGSINQEGQELLDLGYFGSTAPATSFSFLACTSNYTGWQPTLGVNSRTFYGHLTLSSNQSTCVTASPFPYKAYYTGPVRANCSSADDSSQLAQTWSITEAKYYNPFRIEYQLSFIGKRQSDPATDEKYIFFGEYAAERRESSFVPFIDYASPSSITNNTVYDGAPVLNFRLD